MTTKEKSRIEGVEWSKSEFNWVRNHEVSGWEMAVCLAAFVVVTALGWLASLGARGSMRGMDERQALQMGEGVAKILMGCWALALLVISKGDPLRSDG